MTHEQRAVIFMDNLKKGEWDVYSLMWQFAAVEKETRERLIAESPRAKMYRFPDCDPIVIPKDTRLRANIPMGGHVEVALVPVPKPVEEGDET